MEIRIFLSCLLSQNVDLKLSSEKTGLKKRPIVFDQSNQLKKDDNIV